MRSSVRASLICFAVALAGTGFSQLNACSAIVSGDTVQCNTTSDCQNQGGAFARSVCLNNVCVGNCSTTADCVTADGLDPNFASSAYGYLDGGVPSSICVSNQCVPLRDPASYCLDDPSTPQLFGDVMNDNPVVIGLMGDVSTVAGANGVAADPLSAIERYYPQAANIALGNFQGGSTASNVSESIQGTRKVVLVSCRQGSGNGDAVTQKAAQHLADLGAKVIIGPQREAALAQASEVASSNNIAIISPWALTSSAVGNSGNLVYYPNVEVGDIIPPLNAAIQIAETKIRAENPSKTSVRVGVWVYAQTYFTGYVSIVQTLRTGLTFNGQSSAQNMDPGTCTPDRSGSTSCLVLGQTQENASNVLLTTVNEFIESRPDIIIPFTVDEWSGSICAGATECSAPQPSDSVFNYIDTVDPNYHPIYIEPLISVFDTAYLGPKNAKPADLQRYFGIRPSSSTLELVNYLYEWQTNQSAPYLDRNMVGTFESTMLSLYSLYAAGYQATQDNRADFTGLDVAKHIGSSVTDPSSTTLTSALPSDIGAAITTLSGGRSINFHGISSSMKFDNANHAGPGWETWCVTPQTISDEVAFDAQKAAGTGTLLRPNYPAGAQFDAATATFGSSSSTCAPYDLRGSGPSVADAGADSGQ